MPARADDAHPQRLAPEIPQEDHRGRQTRHRLPGLPLRRLYIKHMDDEAHRRLTGAGNRRILDNLRGLFRMGKKVLIRMPLIPGLNDDPAGLEAAFAMLREEAVKGPISRAWNCCPTTAMGRASIDSSGGRTTAAPPPTRRNVWRNSRPFSRPGARKDCPCGLFGTHDSVLEHAEIFYKGGKTWGAPETFSLPSPILP